MRAAAKALLAIVTTAAAQAQTPSPAANRHAAYVSHVIQEAVAQNLPTAGFKGMMIGYLDDFGPVYVPYGVATQDGSVPLNEKTIFGIGSVTKLFAATMLAIANERGLPLTSPALPLLPIGISIPPGDNRYGIRLVDMADHHAGLPKNEGHLFAVLNDLYNDYAADPITCNPSTAELIHDCGCCDPLYMALLGRTPTCGSGVANPVYSCPTHPRTQGAGGWLYSNLGFEVMGNAVATWLGYASWNQANLQEITQPLNLPDTMPLESFTPSQVARAANHCDPATLATNVNCQLLDWLPIGNPAGGLFSTASDMLSFLAYNAYGDIAAVLPPSGFGSPLPASLAGALPIIHQNYEFSPTGGQELAWQTVTLATGELERWKNGANGPFNSWVAYVGAPLPRMIVLLDNSGGAAANLAAIGTQVLTEMHPAIPRRLPAKVHP